LLNHITLAAARTQSW